MAAGGSKRVGRIGERTVSGALAALLDLTCDCILFLDGDGLILLANGEAARLVGSPCKDIEGSVVSDLLESGTGQDDASGWPFSRDGLASRCRLKRPGGRGCPVMVRCDRVSGPGETYLLVMDELDPENRVERENTRLVDELSQANHRLAGTLRIVLGTLDSRDVGHLFGRVLEELRDTMEAEGAIIYLAEQDGFRLRGITDSLADKRVPQFMAYGETVETLATRVGHTLRLRLAPPTTKELRGGHVTRREVIDDETHEVHRISANLLPPFRGFLCVPVWFGGHVIAIIEVGWSDGRAMHKEDGRLLDAVAQYLSVELMAAFSQLRSRRAARLDTLAGELRETFVGSAGLDEGAITDAFDRLCDELSAELAVVRVNEAQRTAMVDLPGKDSVDFPFDLDVLEEGFSEDGVAVLAISAGSDLSCWLARQDAPCLGALLDMGSVSGMRRCVLLLRESGSEPFEDVDLDFLHRIADDIRQAVAGVEARTQDTRISQALQSGMRNELQKVDGVMARALYSSATAAAFVGGDFYDLIRLPDRRACVILGDVSGKGVEAASVSAAVKTALGAYAWEGLPPAHMVRSLNDFLLGFSRLETFATLFVGLVDLEAATLTYCSAGHPPAMLLRASTHELQTLDVQSGVVGAFREMTYRDGVISLERGDLLLLYTDGVTEARGPKGDFFGEDGLSEALMRETQRGTDGLLDRLLQTLDAFTDRHLDDDVAMMSLRFDELGPVSD